MEWVLGKLSDLDLSPHPWRWSCIFTVRFWHSCISGLGRAIRHITKAVWVDSKLDQLHVCDLKVWPWPWISRSNFETPYVVRPTVTLIFEHPWPWARIVKVQFSKSYMSATGGPIDIERKGYMCLIQCWTHYANFNCDLNYDLRVNIWIFTVKFWNDCIHGMDGPIDIKQEGYKSLDLTHDIDLGFSRLDFENNYIWYVFRCYVSARQTSFISHLLYQVAVGTNRDDVRNVGVSVVGFLFIKCGHRRCLPILWYDKTTTVVMSNKRQNGVKWWVNGAEKLCTQDIDNHGHP